MKSFLLLLVALGWVVEMNAQNLVPNFSFEQSDTCPTAEDQIQRANGWTKYSIPPSTPDYYNACAPAGFFSVPSNAVGYQPEHRNCNAYAGVGTRGSVTNDREHIGIQLTQPLIIGQKYFLSFYTVMGEEIIGSHQFGNPSNNIGIRLSTISYNETHPSPIDNFAHLYSVAIIDDSINWLRISGSIIADSAYDYLIVGNFFDDAHTDTMHYTCDSCLNSLSYYFVDDICLSLDSLFANGGIDLLPCGEGTHVNEIISEDVNAFPNPATSLFTITNPSGIKHLTLTNSIGQIVYQKSAFTESSADKVSVDVSGFPAGVYFVQLKDEREVWVKEVVVQH